MSKIQNKAVSIRTELNFKLKRIKEILEAQVIHKIWIKIFNLTRNSLCCQIISTLIEKCYQTNLDHPKIQLFRSMILVFPILVLILNLSLMHRVLVQDFYRVHKKEIFNWPTWKWDCNNFLLYMVLVVLGLQIKLPKMLLVILLYWRLAKVLVSAPKIELSMIIQLQMIVL